MLWWIINCLLNFCQGVYVPRQPLAGSFRNACNIQRSLKSTKVGRLALGTRFIENINYSFFTYLGEIDDQSSFRSYENSFPF